MAGPNGLKVGEARVHPFISLGLEYDSAAGFFNPTDATELSDELIGHVKPGLTLDLDSPSAEVKFGGHVDYVWYTGWLSDESPGASRLEAEVDFGTKLNRDGAVEVDISDTLSRSDRTTNAGLAIGVLSLHNELRLAFPIHPGGGALEVIPKGSWGVEIFEPLSTVLPAACTIGLVCEPTTVSGMSYHSFSGGLGFKWRFLPKTAFVIDSGFSTRTYDDPAANPKPYLLSAGAGIAGLISPKISVVAKAGWAQDFNTGGARTITGHGEFGYLASARTTLRVGYVRDLRAVPIFGTYTNDRPYVNVQLSADRFLLKVGAAYDYLTFHGPSGGRNDSQISASIGPEYRFAPWLTGGIGYGLSVRDSSLVANALNFARHEVYGSLTATY